MSGGIPGTQADIDHAIFLAERRAPAAAAAVEEAAFWLDRRIGRAASGEREALTKQRTRLSEAARQGGFTLSPVRETAPTRSTNPGTGAGQGPVPQTADFVELGLSESEAAAAVKGLREGRYVSFEDAFWSTRVFEAKRPASAAPDQVKLREKARRFAGVASTAVNESDGSGRSPWGRAISEAQR